MKKITITLAIILISNFTFSQSSNFKKVAIRGMYASLLDPYQPSLTLGFEYNISKKYSIGLDYSHIFYSASLFQPNDINRGFIIKPSFKFWVGKKNDEFIELDVFWKKQTTSLTRWIGQDYSNGFASYYKKDELEIAKNVYGFNLKIGQRVQLFDNKIFLEPYIGLGIRAINRYNKNNPDEIMMVKTIVMGDVETNRTYWGISFPAGLRLVVPIK